MNGGILEPPLNRIAFRSDQRRHRILPCLGIGSSQIAQDACVAEIAAACGFQCLERVLRVARSKLRPTQPAKDQRFAGSEAGSNGLHFHSIRGTTRFQQDLTLEFAQEWIVRAR